MRRFLAGLCAALVSFTALGQAVSTTFTLPSIGGVRSTYTPENVNTAPFWHADGNTGAAIESSIDLVQNQAASVNFNTRATDNDGNPLTITLQSGSVTGMSLTAGVFSGTPTVVQAPSLVFRVSDGTLYVEATITINVAAPGTPSDSVPDQFLFVPQTAVTQSATITSAAVVISGINIASAVTVSGGTWNKNGGAYTAGAGTVVAGDSVTVRHTSSVSLNATTQTTLTVGGVSAIFTSTTVANPPRVGIIYTLDFETFAATINNPEDGQWPVAKTSATDGMLPDHLAEAQFGAAANVRALPHQQIVSATPTPCSGLFASVATIYPKPYSPTVDYSIGPAGNKFQPSDKPRVNYQMQSALGGLAWRTTYWWAICVWMPSTYVEETVGGWNEILIQDHTDVKNVWDLELNGNSGGGSSWLFALRSSNSVDSSASSEVKKLQFDVLASHKGAWNVFIGTYNADNRTPANGGSAFFKVWHCTYDEITLAVEIPCALKFNDTTPFGYSNVGMPTGHQLSLNLYKGGWHGATQGVYDGGKTDPISIGFDAFRWGSASAAYGDVHPYQEAQP